MRGQPREMWCYYVLSVRRSTSTMLDRIRASVKMTVFQETRVYRQPNDLATNGRCMKMIDYTASPFPVLLKSTDRW